MKYLYTNLYIYIYMNEKNELKDEKIIELNKKKIKTRIIAIIKIKNIYIYIYIYMCLSFLFCILKSQYNFFQ